MNIDREYLALIFIWIVLHDINWECLAAPSKMFSLPGPYVNAPAVSFVTVDDLNIIVCCYFSCLLNFSVKSISS